MNKYKRSIRGVAVSCIIIILLIVCTSCASNYSYIVPDSKYITYHEVDENGEPMANSDGKLITREIDLVSCTTEELKLFRVIEYPEKFGEVETAKRAYEVAVTVFSHTYENYHDCVKYDSPFEVFFNTNADAWIVKGTNDNPNLHSGVGYVGISRENGEIIMLFHYK